MMKPVDFARVGIEGGTHFTDELPAVMSILGDPLVGFSLGYLREDFGTTGNHASWHIGHRESLHCFGILNGRGR
jgi:hypothetical protein